MVTKNDIFKLLKNCGIKPDDKVTVHVSLRSIGKIENGADGMIDAFCEYLCDGLFIVPTHTWASVTKEHPFYDVKKSEPCIGTLAKVAAKRPDGVRSLHPTHSVTVFGKGAAEYVKGEEKSASPAPPAGCLGRLYEQRGKILLIGVGHERNTYLHAVDERLRIPDRLSEDAYIITIRDENGREIKSPPFHGHYTKGIDTCCSDFYPNYKDAFDKLGGVVYSQLGSALVYCCDARRLTDIVKMLWEKTDRDLCVSPQKIPHEYYM